MTALQEDMKTMTFLFSCLRKKVKSSLNLSAASTHTYPCSNESVVAVSDLAATSTKTGFFKERRHRSSTFLVIVAENRHVTRSFEGSNLIILFISSSKPILRMASPSSIISICRLWKTKPLVFSRWSRSLPGVATSKLTPFLSWFASEERLAPPITTPWVLL